MSLFDNYLAKLKAATPAAAPQVATAPQPAAPQLQPNTLADRIRADAAAMKATGWVFNQNTYQSNFTREDDEGEVIQKSVGGHLLGALAWHYGVREANSIDAAMVDYHGVLSDKYNCDTAFFVALEDGFDMAKNSLYKDSSGYILGYELAKEYL